MTDPLSTNAKSPESLRENLVKSFADFESSFRQRYPLVWIATLIMPVVLSVLILVSLGFAFDWEYPRDILLHAITAFFMLGRFIILMGSEGDVSEKYKILLSPGELFAMVSYMDFMVALFVTFHMNFIFRLPYFGPKVAMLVWDGKFILDTHPWIKRIAFFGLVIFVIFPTSTTGSIGGSIFGRLLGLSRTLTVCGILLGSLLGNGLMYLFSKQINQYVDPENYGLKIVGIAIVVVLIVLLELRYQHVKKKFLASNQETDAAV